MQPSLYRNSSRPLRAFVMLTMALSGVVFAEPAPFDVLIAIFFVMLLTCGWFYIPRVINLPLGLLALFLFFNCTSAADAVDNKAMATFLITNVYMTVIFFSFAAIVYSWRDGVSILLTGYLTSCVLVGGISLFFFFSGHHPDVLFLFGRLRGTFKDPNVFAPFMIFGILYCILRIENCSGRVVPLYISFLIVLVLCVILSASRGAWVNLAAAFISYMAARLWQGSWSKADVTKLSFLVLVLGAAAIIVVTAVNYAQFGEFLAMRAQMQRYDESRFAVQALGLQMAMSNPLGYGPGQFEVLLGSTVWTGSNAAHSLFVRLLFENGVGGFVSLVAFMGASLVVAVRLATVIWRFRTVACIIASSLIGSIVNSAVIDTLHWRHFWIQLGITWGLYVVYRRERQGVTSASDDVKLTAQGIPRRESRQQSVRPRGSVCGVVGGKAGRRWFFA
jgi:O-antigen ligase